MTEDSQVIIAMVLLALTAVFGWPWVFLLLGRIGQAYDGYLRWVFG